MGLKLTLKRHCEHCGEPQLRFTNRNTVWLWHPCTKPIPGPQTPPREFRLCDVIVEPGDAERPPPPPRETVAGGDKRRQRVASTLCACHMTDGFCAPLSKPECRCWKLADTVLRAIDDWPAPAHLRVPHG